MPFAINSCTVGRHRKQRFVKAKQHIRTAKLVAKSFSLLLCMQIIIWTVVILLVAMLVAPIAIGKWYIPAVRERTVIPVTREQADMHCIDAESDCFHKPSPSLEESNDNDVRHATTPFSNIPLRS